MSPVPTPAPAGPSGRGEPLVTVETRGTVSLITLRRAEKLNALSMGLEQALLDAVNSEAVRSSRAIVITGSGRAFSAGADVTEIRGLDPESIAAYYRGSGAVYETVAALPQVTVSAIHGYCLGGGLELALATDFRVCDEGAVFGFPEVGLGIVPSSGGLLRAVRICGVARTRELVLLGDKIDAAAAYRLGLVTEIRPAGQALERAVALAETAAAYPRLAVAVAKQAIDAIAESPAAAALLLERLAYGMLNQTADTKP